MNVATNSDMGRISVMANDDPPALVPERVRRLRQGLGFSQAGLAEVSGVSQSTISRIEKGTPHKVSGENERALAKALGTTVDYLMGRTAEQGTHQPAPRAHGPRAGAVAEDLADGTPLERTLGIAFDATRHLLRDIAAVQKAVGEDTFQWQDADDAVNVDKARAWLDAAAALRRAGAKVTSGALLDAVTFGKTQRAREVAAEREAAANAEADAKLAADDEIVPLSPAQIEQEKEFVRRAMGKAKRG